MSTSSNRTARAAARLAAVLALTWAPVGVLTLAPEEGLGVRDAEKREKHLAAINRFRGV